MELLNDILYSKTFTHFLFLFCMKFYITLKQVDHVVLLNKKLSKYGIRGIALEWFRSYLTDREQFLSLNGQNSSLCSNKSGVLQGSILSP